MPPTEFDPAARRNAEVLISLALFEDLGEVGDVTSAATIPKDAHGAALFVARSQGVIAGLPVLELIAQRFDVESSCRPLVKDGDPVGPGTVVASIAGPMRELLMLERTALNFLQRLSGVATLTARFVDAISGTNAVILDTRKTTPGWRSLEKYAVRCGGGGNHRIGLFDAVLIKDNHLAWLESLGELDPIVAAVAAARAKAPAGTVVEVEVDSLDQLDRALGCAPDIVLVDNIGAEGMAEAVRRRDARAPRVKLEASGGVSLATVSALAKTGVDRISVGALTHSAPALDIGLDFDQVVAAVNIALLCQLREAGGGFVPIDALGPSPDRTLGDLDELSAFGFAIERHPYRGAAYLGPAARLCPDQIEYKLGTRRVGRRVSVWNRVASTNDLAARAAASTANEGLVVLAEEQTAGRGRRGRAWTAPPRTSVLMSVLLFPSGDLAEPAWLTALAAVAVAEVVSEWAGVDAAIKWPNDVRVDGRKLSGILVERGAGSVIGIGLNANIAPDEFPDDLRDSATSLRTLLGRPVDRSELVRALVRRLDDRYDLSERQGPEVLNAPWRDRSEHLGCSVEVSTPAGVVRGRLDDLDLFRGLRLTGEDGQTVRVLARHVLTIAPILDGSGPRR